MKKNKFMASRLWILFAPVLTSCTVVASCQQANTMPASPSIVQPGAPGQGNKSLTATTTGVSFHEPSEADTKFMQGMILHHSQAVEMTELLRARSKSNEVQALGQRISISQTDEMKFMRQWLEDRGKKVPSEQEIKQHGQQMDMSQMDHEHMDHAHMDHDMGSMSMPLMPGMLTPEQMKALAAATGTKFDYLFLTGMIQHHTGALTMVKDLFDMPGAGQDPQLFDFAMDVDNTQQAEIDIMRGILKEKK